MIYAIKSRLGMQNIYYKRTYPKDGTREQGLLVGPKTQDQGSISELGLRKPRDPKNEI